MMKEEVFKKKMAGIANATQELIEEAKEVLDAANSEDGDLEGAEGVSESDLALVTDAQTALGEAKAIFNKAAAE